MRARKVRAGIVRAKNRGVHCGRPRRSFPLAEALKLRKKGLSLRAVAEKTGIPVSTVADALRQAVSKKRA
jgi:DNA invertase Pin-like site-specific DNA recombinase